MIKPIRSFVFLAILLAVTVILANAWPEGGIRIAKDVILKFPSPESLKLTSNEEKKEHSRKIKDLIEALQKSLADKDSTDQTVEEEDGQLFNRQALRLQYARTGAHPLEPFFRKLTDISSLSAPLHVMHFGDSQIEGDRMTGFIRRAFTKRFGGSGPGLLPAIEAVPSFAVEQSSSGKWNRFALFGGPKPNIGHFNFGPLQNFARFESNGENATASLFYRPHPKSAGVNRKYSVARLFLGNTLAPCTVEFIAWDTVLKHVEIPEGMAFKELRVSLDSVPNPLEIRFTGAQSPDIYAVSLETGSGVIVDNIGMRGSSGTDFTRMGRAHLATVLNPFNLGLVILQYGGNTVPHITSDESAKQYGKWFGAQIKLIHDIVPDCGIVVIGPSDMSTMIDGEMQTFPYLEKVRDALKEETIKAGAAYWDLYEIMGGKNSMPIWVNADPPLAASDHIHFAPEGARTTADLFVTYLLEEFDKFNRGQNAP